MSLETQIAALVTAANNLTAAVNGKMGQIDQKVLDAKAAYDAQLANVKAILPRMAVTRNLRMRNSVNAALIDNWGIHAEVTATHVMNIAATSEATGRPASNVLKLAEIEADVKEQFPDFSILKSAHYRNDFNIWRMQWAANASGVNYLAFPHAADGDQAASVPRNSYLTLGGFVRVVEGGLENQRWAKGWQLGKWRWCSDIQGPSRGFGSYVHMHPNRNTSAGIVEVALAGAVTGVIEHPGEWFAMFQLGAASSS